MGEKKYYFSEIESAIEMNCTVQGKKEDITFITVKPIDEAEEHSLVWVNSKKDIDVSASKAKVILVDPGFKITEELLRTKIFIVVENPKLAYIRIVEKYFIEKPKYEIHPTAFVHPEAKVHSKTHIGPFSYVGKSTIGEGTILYGHCFIYDNVIIGNNVIIQAGAIIGGDGYGYSRNEQGKFEKFPHVGGVIIEDSVEIGANTCVDKGTLGNTIIREGAKIDNLVHIAHNVVVGKHAAVIAHSMIGGSTEIGDYSWIAPSAALMNGISIGNKATVGLGAVVTKNIPDGETWAGLPAQPLKDFVAIQKKLKELK